MPEDRELPPEEPDVRKVQKMLRRKERAQAAEELEEAASVASSDLDALLADFERDGLAEEPEEATAGSRRDGTA